MIVRVALPTYDLYGLMTRPGDILGRTKPGSLIEHRALLWYDMDLAHTSGPGDVFRPGRIEEILKDGGWLRVVYPTNSVEETELRFLHATRLFGVRWWDMNCIQTTDFIVQQSRISMLM
jgi:hypothetical protein